MRIAIAGFQHETNTFVSAPTQLPDFVQADSWPGLLTGDEVIDETAGMNLPIAGFIDAARQVAGVTILPILWCAAEPGGRVSDEAFETIAGRILDALAQMGQFDAVYLDLHGAMVTQSLEDGEGQLLSRVRQLIGAQTPLVASLDMHANLSQQMIDNADVLTIYRTYPHIDMAETGARSFAMLKEISKYGTPAKAWRQVDYLIPLSAQHTGSTPARELYAELQKFDQADVQLAEIALGFTAADIHDTGPSVLCYSQRQEDADKMADHLFSRFQTAEAAFDCALLNPDEAVSKAIAASHAGPVVIADVQDNPGAGATSDTTGLLRELIRQKSPRALLGLVHDPALAAQAHRSGEGSWFKATIGGRGPGDCPVVARVEVLRVSDGTVAYTGQMYGGGVATLGPSAALRLIDTEICIVVNSIRNQCLDLAQFHHFGLEPESARLVCVKSTAHFRADFEPIAQDVLLTAVPGLFPCRLEQIEFTNLRQGVRRAPEKGEEQRVCCT